MPTLPIGDNNLYAVVRHYIEPTITDVVYQGSPFTYRLYKGNRRVQSGSPHIEIPMMYADLASGGWYGAWDVITATPTETVQNMYFDWKQLTVPVILDETTLFKANTANAIANIVVLQSEQARMRMRNLLATAVVTSTGSDSKQILGLPIAVDSTGTYGGLSRSTYSWLASTEDASTAALGLPALNSHFNNVSEGGRHPSIILSNTAHYEAFWALGTAYVQQDMGPTGRDEQLFSAGFSNALFNGVPWVRDPNIANDGATGRSPIFMLNEDYFDLYVGEGQDFTMSEFRRPVNQKVYVSELDWRGALVCRNPARQGKMTNVA